jgi:hypothetical protein
LYYFIQPDKSSSLDATDMTELEEIHLVGLFGLDLLDTGGKRVNGIGTGAKDADNSIVRQKRISPFEMGPRDDQAVVFNIGKAAGIGTLTSLFTDCELQPFPNVKREGIFF